MRRPLTIISSPYQMINILTGLVIILVFAYSALISNGNGFYTVGCVYVKFYGEGCTTCGLSRSFSEIFRGRYSSALNYNSSGPLIFIFFASQLVLRTMVGLIIFRIDKLRLNYKAFLEVVETKNKRDIFLFEHYLSEKINVITFSDSVISILLFVFCFRYLLVFW